MRRVTYLCAFLLFASAGLAPAQESPPPKDDAPPSSPMNWLVSESAVPVTAGDMAVDPGLWQHTWGIAAFDAFPVGDKMAPNGVPYDPLFSLDLLLNIAITSDRTFYIFANGRFWAQKPGEGITNPKQGAFDFSKRQFDLDAGFAWNFYKAFEGRVFFYSDNNLNRGRTLDRPFGYKDGAGLEVRYYLPTTDFDKGLYRFFSIGYLPTKELVGNDGEAFKPSLFLTANVAFDIIPEKFYLYADNELIFERPLEARLWLCDPGVACRPFERAPNLELRIGVENTIDLGAGYTRSLLYGSARVVW